MDAPRALVFRPLVKGNEALGKRLKRLLIRYIYSLLGQTCGGIGYIIGRCAKGLKCSLPDLFHRNPVGHCISLVKPTATPVQKLLTKKAFVDEANLEQQSNFARQNIPGLSVSKMAETGIHPKQKNIIPENYSKHNVDSSEMESMSSARLDNGAAMMNRTNDQARQKKPNKGMVVNVIWSCSRIGSRNLL